MKKYILITPYPGSPPRYTIVTWNNKIKLFFYRDKNNVTFYFSKESIIIFDNWEIFRNEELKIPVGSYFISSHRLGGFKKIHKIVAILDHFNVKVDIINLDKDIVKTTYFTVDALNTVFKSSLSGNYKITESFEEIEEFVYNNTPILNINDIATVYKSAKNEDYQQCTQLKELIKSKLL